MKKISVAYIVNDLVVGGVSTVVINLCNGLDPGKYNIYLFVLSNNTPMEKIIPLKPHINKIIIDYKFSPSYSLLTYLKISFLFKETKQRAIIFLNELKKLKIDILHFHTLPRQLNLGQLAQKQNPKLKLVFTDHLIRLSASDYNWYQKFILEATYRKLYKNYNLISVSKAVYNSIIKNKRNDTKKEFNLLENSINLKDYNRTKDLKNFTNNRFIYVSRMNHHKGQETLIKAWQAVHLTQKGKLVFVGPDETNGKFHQLANDDSSIEFMGSVSNVKELLNNSNFAIFPSQKEGLPIALLEMMAFELPLIVSDIPELTSIIENSKEGLHFRLDNVKDLIKQIEFAINNPEDMTEYGKNARRKVERICSDNNPIVFHEEFYSQLQ